MKSRLFLASLICLTAVIAQTGNVYFDDLVKDTDCMNLNVTVCVMDSFGWHVPDLMMSNFHFAENGDPVVPPRITKLNECEGSCSDIILLFDLSGSMDDKVDSFEAALADFASPLAGLDYRIAMAVFNGCPEQIDGVRKLVRTDFSAPPGTTGTDIWATSTSEVNHLLGAVQMYFDLPWSLRGSGWEDQFGALWWAIDTLDWRSGCKKNAVMFTDEEVQVETAPCVPFFDEEDSSLYKIMDYCLAESVTFFAVCPEDSNFEWYPASGDSPDRQYYTGYRELAGSTGGIWSDLLSSDYSTMVSELAEAIAGIPCCYEFRYMTNFYCLDSIEVSVDVTLGAEYLGTDDTSYLSFCQPEITPVMPEFCGGITTCVNQQIIGYFENQIYGALNLTNYIFTVNGDTVNRAEVAYSADSLIYSPSTPFGHMDTVVFEYPIYRNEWNCVGNTPPCTFYVDTKPPFVIEHFPADGDTILVTEFEIYGRIWDDFAGIDVSSVGHISVLLDGDTAVISSPIWSYGDTTHFRIDSLLSFWDGDITVCLGGILDHPDYDYCPPNMMPDTCWSFYLATLERLVSFPVMSGAPCETVMIPLEIDEMEWTLLESARMRFRVNPTVLTPLGIVTMGTITAGWLVDSLSIDLSTGEIYAEISGSVISGLSGGGILLYLKALVPCNAVGGRYCNIEIREFAFNEGYPMVIWTDGFFVVTLLPQVFFCDVHLNRTSTPASADNTVTFGATYGGTDDFNPGLDQFYVPPPDWMVDGWFELDDAGYPHIFGLRRDVRAPSPTVRWHLVTRNEPNGIAWWNPIALPEGEFRMDSLIDMKRESVAYFSLNDTLLIEWTLPSMQPDTLYLESGWNLVSMPVLPAGMSADEVLPSDYGVFHYNTPLSAYEFADEIRDGYGYWVFANRAFSFMTAGSPLEGYRRQVFRGWNIIGAILSPLSVSEIAVEPSGLLIPPIWGWDGSSYFAADSILPGKGYWALSTGTGVIHAPSVYRSREIAPAKMEWEVIIEVIGDGSLLTLTYSPDAATGLSVGDIALPPPSPNNDSYDIYLIEDGFALSRSCSPNGEWRLVCEREVTVEISIPREVAITLNDLEIADGEVVRLPIGAHAFKVSEQELPRKFEVLGCVPNPFNARTDIVVALPTAGDVSAQIFDIMGRKVASISQNCRAGMSRIPWNGLDEKGREVSSGLYFVRVSFGEASENIKVMLIK